MRASCLVVSLLIFGPLSCSGNEGSSALDVALRGDVISFTSGEALADVEVCYEDTCVTTGDDGIYSVMVPAQRLVTLTYEKTGYGPVLIAVTTENQNRTVNAEMLDDTTLQGFALILNTPYPPEGTGLVALTAYRGLPSQNEPISGVALSLANSEGERYYLTDGGIPSTELTETGALGVGGFYEVPPGTINIELTGAAGCEGVTTWAEGPENTFNVPVEERFLTQVVVSCE